MCVTLCTVYNISCKVGVLRCVHTVYIGCKVGVLRYVQCI